MFVKKINKTLYEGRFSLPPPSCKLFLCLFRVVSNSANIFVPVFPQLSVNPLQQNVIFFFKFKKKKVASESKYFKSRVCILPSFCTFCLARSSPHFYLFLNILFSFTALETHTPKKQPHIFDSSDKEALGEKACLEELRAGLGAAGAGIVESSAGLIHLSASMQRPAWGGCPALTWPPCGLEQAHKTISCYLKNTDPRLLQSVNLMFDLFWGAVSCL